MTKTLHAALTPLLIIGSFCSLCLFEYPLGHPRPYISYLYFLAIWIFLNYLTYCFYYPILFTIHIKIEVVVFCYHILTLITAITSILVSLFYVKELKMCLHELSLVDDTMEAVGAPKEYERLRKWISRIIIGWIVYIFYILARFVYETFPPGQYLHLSNYIICFLLTYPEFVHILNALIWGTILRCISSRFYQVSDCLYILYFNLFENNADYRSRRYKSILMCKRITEAENRKQYIWIIMHVHLQLCLTSRKLNKVFKIPMLLQMLYLFLRNMVLYISIYQMLQSTQTMVSQAWSFKYNSFTIINEHFVIILHNIIFLKLNYVCQTIYHKINETVTILHKLSNYNLGEELREQVYSGALAFLIILIQKMEAERLIGRDTKRDENTEAKPKETLGLTTTVALDTLHRDVRRVLQEYEEDHRKNKKYRAWLKDTLHHRSQYTTLCWTSAIALLINAVILIVAFFTLNETWYSTLPYEGLIVCCLVVLNFILVVSDNKLRHEEIPHRVKILLDQLNVARSTCQWRSENYPHLCSPQSPCLTLQWTYRNGEVVNLPWALLVAGDIIVMKPGQQAPGYCVPYNDSEAPVLHAKETYSAPVHSANEIFSTPQSRVPLKSKIYKLQETPYLVNLRMALDQALDRPVTYYNRKRHLLMICCIEHLTYPILVIVILVINLLRYLYLTDYFGTGHWSEMFLLQPIAVSLPLLPLVFPACWIFLNCFGMARFKALVKLYLSAKKLQFVDPFEDADINGPNHPDVVCNWLELKEYFFDILFGNEHMMSRSASILHVLGSVTALCCVDKKGLLSWPNPTAEKVFFLRNANILSPSSSTGSVDKTTDKNQESEETKANSNRTSYVQHDMSHSTAEVLDLTHDHALPFRLQFDDHSWRQHLNSLKPLGLAILLNTCNMDTQEHYTQFCCHVTCEALYNENLVPVTNRRCLCELAKQIGFQDQAQKIFQLEQQLCTFRHVQPEMVRRDIKFARSLSIATKLKFPFPHMVAVVVKERSGGGLQLLTQGTADIILDSCIEYWDGHDLCPLSTSDRKKVQDFYQRTSLTSYCTAFAYRPLTRAISDNMSGIYLELPADSKHLYTPHRSPTPLPWDFRNVLDPRVRGILGQFHSTDSLLCNENKDDDVNDIESCFEVQCNQVFIGMVTMQYQAQTDMVQLIEQLDRACIRFVHFSKENELRSRVFSEKMGLESGWNCHISLLSEGARSESPVGWWVSQAAAMSSPTPSPTAQSHQPNYSCMDEASHLLNRVLPRTNLNNSRAMSMSAPSAINTDFSTVKFDDETTEWNNTGTSQVKSTMSHRDHKLSSREQDTVRSEDSVLVQSVDLGSGQEAWRSLSCLTDSTEQSAPVNFDLSNRAKLPRGIDKIRPHIELIDNVPLLVSLFTDCNTTVTREMLHIMQDYGEVVCVLGSSANAENMPIFMQADAGVAVEPLYPQVCQKVPVLVPPTESQGISPVDLSRALNSVACSLSVKREDPVAIFHLIMEARHYMKNLWNCIQFWLCCVVTLSFVQMLSAFLLLPPLFSIDQILWLCCLIIPVLSTSMIATPIDSTIMQRATGKNQCVVNGEVTLFVLWCYGSKFLPTVITVILSQCISFLTLCPVYVPQNSKCLYIYPDPRDQIWGGWDSKPIVVLVVQHFALTLIVLHFVTISVSFVHREYSIWKKNPMSNCTWFLGVFIVLCVQAIFSGIVFRKFWREESKKIENFPIHVPLFFLFSVPLAFAINELIKWQEIKVNVRYQKRARLEFGTKLGMNSPF